MKVYPLIHSRTGGCDYSSKFAVHPPNFTDAEIKWARSKILPATRNIGLFNGIRRVVASDGKICIAGIVCTMKYFVNNCLDGAEKDEAQPYADIQGTKYGVFLGCAFSKGNAPNLAPKKLWQWFKKYLAEKWNRKVFDGVKSEQEDCDKLPDTDKFSPTEEIFAAQIYDAAAFDDKELFKMYLFETAKRDVAFCSNVEDIQRVEEGVYNAVTTSAGNIAALKARWQEKQRRELEEAEALKKNVKPQTKQSTIQKTTTTKPSESTQTSGKYLLPLLLVGLVILAAIIFW
ncbi:MAG: hypothetical protein IJP68_10525 [Selenomonadaceae bacterium]|nr:hypothetical protein [Selenomonadaceae bacterium]